LVVSALQFFHRDNHGLGSLLHGAVRTTLSSKPFEVLSPVPSLVPASIVGDFWLGLRFPRLDWHIFHDYQILQLGKVHAFRHHLKRYGIFLFSLILSLATLSCGLFHI
jgi:hypothetical protein